MKPEDFDLFATLVKQRSGLILTREKAYLLESRLLPVSRKYNLKSLEDMAQLVRSQRDEGMMQDITEAMTTNETSFFRDRKPFEHLRTVLLPRVMEMQGNRRQIRIWCAAASSGQEAYSLAMMFAEEEAALKDWKIDIIATDLSREMIERAKTGIYSHFEVQRGLPTTMLIKYFQKVGADKWQIRENLRQMVQFREGNLLQDFGPVGVLDVVCCRNVLMYFDSPTQTRVLNAIAAVMAPDGLLLLGASESVQGISDKFRPVEDGGGYYVIASSSAAGFARRAAG